MYVRCTNRCAQQGATHLAIYHRYLSSLFIIAIYHRYTPRYLSSLFIIAIYHRYTPRYLSSLFIIATYLAIYHRPDCLNAFVAQIKIAQPAPVVSTRLCRIVSTRTITYPTPTFHVDILEHVALWAHRPYVALRVFVCIYVRLV
jgi:hypothetical protein